MFGLISFDAILKVRSARNQVMHSADLKLNNNDYNTLVQSMIDLLQDPKVLLGLQDAQTAVTRINEVICITKCNFIRIQELLNVLTKLEITKAFLLFI